MQKYNKNNSKKRDFFFLKSAKKTYKSEHVSYKQKEEMNGEIEVIVSSLL
jgi:hypothetical protein